MGLLGRTSYHTSPWGFYPFLSSFLSPLWPISFHFTFLLPLIIPMALLTHRALPLSLGSHSLFTSLSPFIAFVALLAHWTLFSSFFFSFGFYGPFALLLPFIVPVSLLVVISCHASSLGFFFFFSFFFGLLWPIYFYFAFFILFFFIFACYWVFLLLRTFYKKQVSIVSNNTRLMNAINYLN